MPDTAGNIEVKITFKDDAKELLDVCKDIAELKALVPEYLQPDANIICERISQCIKKSLKLETNENTDPDKDAGHSEEHSS